MTPEPRLISGSDAAAYCGITLNTWCKWVASGVMPKPAVGRRWDKKAIDLVLDKASGIEAQSISPGGQEMTLAEWKVQNEARKAAEEAEQEWQRKYEARRVAQPQQRRASNGGSRR